MLTLVLVVGCSGPSLPSCRRKQRMREVVRAREGVRKVSELDVPLSTLLCRMVTLLSYYEKFLMILQQYDLTTASEWSVVCERVCSRV